MIPSRSRVHVFSPRGAFLAAVAASLILGRPSWAQVHVDQNAPGPVRNGASWVTAFLTVQAGIDAAAGGGEVWVADGVYLESIALGDGVELYGGFTGSGGLEEIQLDQRDIAGAVTTIDAGGGPATHVVVMDGIVDARVDGFTITGGLADGDRDERHGGGILCLNLDGTNAIANCTITGNSAESFGGGIACLFGSSPTITGCLIRENFASSGGGIGVRASSLRVTSCIIENNEAGTGGGVYADLDVSVPLLTDCVIRGNVAGGRGGGVFLADQSAAIANCMIVGNSAFEGGGIYFRSSKRSNLTNCTIADNEATSRGGGVFCFNSDSPIITNCIFANNIGHAIYEGTSNSEPSVSFCLFHNNPDGDYFDFGTSSSYTGATAINWIPDGGAHNNFDADPHFVNEHAGDYHLQDGSNALDRGTLADAPSADFEGDVRPGSDGMIDIGADEAEGDFTPEADTFPPVSFVLGLVPAITQAVFDLPYVASDVHGDITHVRLFYRKDGGAWTQFGATFVESPITFDAPATDGDGFYEFYTLATDTNGNTEDAPVGPDDAVAVVTEFAGSRIHVDLNAGGRRSGLDWNEAFREIGEATIVAESFSIPDIWVAQGTYLESVAFPGGVAMYGGFGGTESELSERDIKLRPTIIDASEAGAFGPAPHVVVMVGISNARLDGFTITGAFSLRSTGGGISCDAVGDGVMIANCTITGNTAVFGGGVACVESSSPAIENCDIVDNIGLFGGGLYCSDSSPMVTACRISGNRDDVFGFRDGLGVGGGVALFRSSPTLTNCIIRDNRVSQGGFSGSMSLGGGVYCSQSFPVIVNCTLAMNRANFGGGIFSVMGSSPTIVNSIFSMNEGWAIFEFDAESDATVSHCLFFDNIGGDYFDEGETTYTGAEAINANVAEANGNVDGFPIFVDVRNGDFHLRDGSAALDRGSIAEAPATDFDGAPRPGSDGLVDIGAFEAEGSFIPLPPFPPSGARHWLKYP